MVPANSDLASPYAGCKRVFHWGPIIALSIIFYITTCALYVITMWWPPQLADWLSLLHLVIFLGWFAAILYNYLSGLFLGPGFVPLGWRPALAEDAQFLQWCNYCSGYKPPRAHHCRKCDRCVLKMDHHCPWINTCCGHRNHAFFTRFLVFAPLGCIHAACVLAIGVYRALYVNHYVALAQQGEAFVFMSMTELLGCFFAFGLALGVVLAVGGLCYIQVKGMLRNETQIESWIKEKAYFRTRDPTETEEFRYPYDLGSCAANLYQVCTWSGHTRGDGYEWPLAPGAAPYDLTIEQLLQKREKIVLSRKLCVVTDFAGSFLPLAHGCSVCLRPPCSDEGRLALRRGQVVRVTRWRSHWLYGQVVLDVDAAPVPALDASRQRLRGWFPKCCVAEPVNKAGWLEQDLDEMDKQVLSADQILGAGVNESVSNLRSRKSVAAKQSE